MDSKNPRVSVSFLSSGKSISMVKKLFGVSTTFVDIPDSLLFPSPPRTLRPRFVSSPDRGFGNLVRPSVSSAAEEENFFDAHFAFYCSGISNDLLELVLPSLCVGCSVYFASHPEVCQISFCDLFKSIFSHLSAMDFGSLSSSLETVPVTRSLEVSDVGSIVEAPSLPPESNCESHRLALIVGTLFLAVLLTGPLHKFFQSYC